MGRFRRLCDFTQIMLLTAFVHAKYPNEIVDTPVVTCEPDRVLVKVKTSAANPSHIYAEDFHEASNCMVRNMNTIGIALGECGMTTERMESPQGTMYRICIAVQIHPLFVTDSDRSYCAQCVYMDANVIDDLEQSIAISEPTPNELEPQFDGASNPQCSYSIRKGAVDGPEVHAAVVGETVFHVWQCNNDGVGLLVQNCHVEDLAGDKILIIDQNGCGVDQYLFKTPQYASDLQMAYLESNVFKFVDKSMTRFRCQLRLCMKNRGHGCENISPPNSCPSLVDDPPTEPQVDSLPLPSTPLSGPPVDSPQPHGPPGFTAAVAAVQKPAPEVATVAPIIGPPSIRPFGLSTARHVQAKTFGQAVAAARIPTAVERSGYQYPARQRRSIMIYGNATRLAAEHVQKRSVPPREPPRRVRLSTDFPELDVIGLIRVLDNPEEDHQYEVDKRRSEFRRSSPPVPPEAGSSNTVEPADLKCVTHTFYWAMIVALVVLLSVQLSALGVFIVDRFILKRSFSKEFRVRC